MVRLEQMAEAALGGDALVLRALAQEWLRENPLIINSVPPTSNDADILATAAALVELLALRTQQPPPSWTARIGPVRNPTYLVKAARTMPRLRQSCAEESPLPLRRRGLFAPPDFLSFA